MLDICSAFADDKTLQFNASKTPICCPYPHFVLLVSHFPEVPKGGLHHVIGPSSQALCHGFPHLIDKSLTAHHRMYLKTHQLSHHWLPTLD